MRTSLLAAGLIGIFLASAHGAAAADPGARTPETNSSCFLSHDWDSWKATPGGRSIHIKVGGNRIYRLDTAQACPALTSIGVHLVTSTRGSSWICRPVDLDLKIADNHGFATPCIVSGITRLTDAEAKALPKALQP